MQKRENKIIQQPMTYFFEQKPKAASEAAEEAAPPLPQAAAINNVEDCNIANIAYQVKRVTIGGFNFILFYSGFREVHVAEGVFDTTTSILLLLQ